MTENHILKFSWADCPGLMAKVTGLLFQNGTNILESQQFNDRETGLSFMRVAFELQSDIQSLQKNFEPLAKIKSYFHASEFHSPIRLPG